MKISDTKAYKYASWCAHSGSSKVPKYVRLQAQQWLDIADGKAVNRFTVPLQLQLPIVTYKLKQCNLSIDIIYLLYSIFRANARRDFAESQEL